MRAEATPCGPLPDAQAVGLPALRLHGPDLSGLAAQAGRDSQYLPGHTIGFTDTYCQQDLSFPLDLMMFSVGMHIRSNKVAVAR